MAARKKPNDPVMIYYGINEKSLNVQMAWFYRNQTLSCGTWSHHVLPGRRAENELSLILGLTDIRGMSPELLGTESDKQIIKELKEKAERLRARQENK